MAGSVKGRKLKKYTIKPNMRQKRAIDIIVESNGKKSVSRAMREAGYSPKSAKNPKALTESVAWKQLMDKYLPEDLIAKKHLELLNAKTVQSFIIPKDVAEEQIEQLKEDIKEAGGIFRSIQHTQKGTFCFYFAPDGATQKSMIDMAHKLRGTYAAEKRDVKVEGLSLKDLYDGSKRED